MAKRLGFIQTGGIGDLLMILPIADHYIEQGWEIVWPIDHRCVEMFRRVKPSINFISVDGSPSERRSFYLERPLALIGTAGCDKTIMFYIPMFGLNIGDARLAHALKFDEYKYAIAGVPFRKKWELAYERDIEREQDLFESLQITGPYVCVHEDGSDVQLPMAISSDVRQTFQVIDIRQRTDSIFDWRLTLERASHLYLIDSCFSNLVEQLNLPVAKSLLLRSQAAVSPVLKNDWNFFFSDPSDLLMPAPGVVARASTL